MRHDTYKYFSEIYARKRTLKVPSRWDTNVHDNILCLLFIFVETPFTSPLQLFMDV